MSHPYRTPPPAPQPVPASRRDDAVLRWLLVCIGSIRVALALVQHEAFGGEATLAAMMVVAGLAFV